MKAIIPLPKIPANKPIIRVFTENIASNTFPAPLTMPEKTFKEALPTLFSPEPILVIPPVTLPKTELTLPKEDAVVLEKFFKSLRTPFIVLDAKFLAIILNSRSLFFPPIN